MRKLKVIIGVLLTLGLACATNAELSSGQTIGIDFGSVATSAGVNFNDFGNPTVLSGASASFSGALINTDGGEVTGIGFSVQNNTGQDTVSTVSVGGNAGLSPFDEATIYGDRFISNENSSRPIADTGHFLLIFTGLNDSQTYNISGGYDGGNNNFDSTWSIVTDSQTQTFASTTGANAYQTMTDVHSVGGELIIKVNERTKHVCVGGLTLTAVGDAAAAPVLVLSDETLSLDLLASDTSTNGTVTALYVVGASSSNDIQIVSISTVLTNGFSGSVVSNLLGTTDTDETITVTYTNDGTLANDGDTTNNTLVVSWTELTSGVTNTLEVALDVTYIKDSSTFALDQDSLVLTLITPETTTDGTITASFTPGTLSADVDIISAVTSNGFSASVTDTMGISNPSEEIAITYDSGSATNRGDVVESDLVVTWTESGSDVTNAANATLTALYLVPELSSWTAADVTNPTYWDLGVSTNWTSSDMLFYYGDAVTFGNTGAGAVSVRSQMVSSAMTFVNTNSYDYTFDDVTANVESISAPVGGINVLSNGNVALNVKITGDTDITHSGTGTLILGGGGVANDFVGTITVDGGGTLQNGATSPDILTSLGDFGNTFVFRNGSSFDVTSGTGLDRGFMGYGTGSFVFEDGTTLINTSSTTKRNAFDDELVFAGDVTIDGVGRVDIDGDLGVTGTDIVITLENDAGCVLGGGNSGKSIAEWIVNDGFLYATVNDAFGDAVVTVNTNGAITGNIASDDGGLCSISNSITLNGGTFGANQPNTATEYAGTITVTAESSIDPDDSSRTVILSGALAESGTGGDLTLGNGTILIASTLDATGFSGNLVLNDTGTLALENSVNLIQDIVISTNGGNKVISLTAGDSAELSGNITVNDEDNEQFDFNVTSNYTLTVSGVISGDGGAGITKTSSGNLILAGDNTYTGPTLFWNGVVQVNGDSSAASNTVTILGAATLSGTGTVGGAVTVNGTVAPGASVGTLTCLDDVTITNGTFSVEAGDLLAVGGNLKLTNATLSIDGTLSGPVTIATVGGTITGTFNGLDEGAEVQAGYTISYLDGAVKIAGSSSEGPTVSASISGSSLSLSWDGGGSYNVLTNSDLTNSEGWGVATNATSPVDLEIGSESELFYKLESE
jgi:autotransporter-associated beta strand protein